MASSKIDGKKQDGYLLGHLMNCKEVFPGECLISRLPDPVGRSCIIPEINDRMITAVDCTILRFDRSRVLPEFFKYYSQSQTYLSLVSEKCTGATRKRISRKNLGLISIPLPPLPEQQRIVSILDEVFDVIGKAVANHDRNIENSRELFESYLDGVFSQKGEGWVQRRLIEECDILMGQSPEGTSYNNTGEGIPLINGPVEFGGLNPFSMTVATKFTTNPTKMCKKGDLILCVRGSTTGRMNIAGQDACIGRGVAAIRSKENQDWVNQFISFSKDIIYDLGSGSTFPNVSASTLKKLIIPFPPKEQREGIVERIEILDSNIQNLVKIYQSKLTALEELKQSILQKAFTGELTSKTVDKIMEPV